MVKVLIAEDDPALMDALRYNLARQAYEVCAVKTPERVIEAMREEHLDLIVPGLASPQMDSEQAGHILRQTCHRVRQATISPILVLAPRVQDIDGVKGPAWGADDYLIKPFSMREFLARTKALLRRATFIRRELGSDGDPLNAIQLRSGNLIIDQVRRKVTRDESMLRLKPKEYELLVFLVRNRGVAPSRALIL